MLRGWCPESILCECRPSRHDGQGRPAVAGHAHGHGRAVQRRGVDVARQAIAREERFAPSSESRLSGAGPIPGGAVLTLHVRDQARAPGARLFIRVPVSVLRPVFLFTARRIPPLVSFGYPAPTGWRGVGPYRIGDEPLPNTAPTCRRSASEFLALDIEAVHPGARRS